MVNIIVVRHGQSTADVENLLEGKADFPLTKLGREQAELLAGWLTSNYKIDTIISSPLKRAAETADIINSKVKTNLLFNDSLMEMNNGIFAGMNRAEADDKYPLPVGGRKIYDNIPEGENMIEFRARAQAFWSKLMDSLNEDHEDRCICIVSHGKMIAMLFRCLLNLPIDTNIWIKTSDTGVHLWRIKDNERVIVYGDSQRHFLEI